MSGVYQAARGSAERLLQQAARDIEGLFVPGPRAPSSAAPSKVLDVTWMLGDGSRYRANLVIWDDGPL
eukprot:3916772-Alexandrium_andersonii.AAC.1